MLKSTFLRLGLFYVISFCLTACGASGGSSSNGSSASTSGSVQMEYGSATIGIDFTNTAKTNLKSVDATTGDVCTDNGIKTIKVSFKSSSGLVRAQGSFECSSHRGTVSNIPVGKYTVSVEGVLTDNSIGWQGNLVNIDVVANINNNIGTVKMEAIPNGYIFVGSYVGTFDGGDNGTWNATINSSGNISGTAYSILGNTTYGVSGTIYSNGNMVMTAGSVTTGAKYSGSINSSGAMNGTWINSYYNLTGTYSGQRK